jgi:hypothetical protein
MNTFLVSVALSEANNESKERERESSFETESCVSTIKDENHVASHKGDNLLLYSPVAYALKAIKLGCIRMLRVHTIASKF